MSAEATGWVWKHSPMSGAGLLVHLAIADVVNDVHGNELWMTFENLAAKAKVSRTKTVTAVRELCGGGYLEKLEAGGGRGNKSRFRFLFPETGHSLAGLPDAKPVTPESQTGHSANETGHSDARYKEEPKEPNNPSACASAKRQPDPDCPQCQGRGVKGYTLVDPAAGRSTQLPCDCRADDYQPRAARSGPPAGWINPLATRRAAS